MKTIDTKPQPNDFYGDSKLQAENGLKELECPTFKVCILRPPMIYDPGNKGNLPRLGWLATKTPIFPEWHNKRSMLYVEKYYVQVMSKYDLEYQLVSFEDSIKGLEIRKTMK